MTSDEGLAVGAGYVFEVPELASQYVEAISATGSVLGSATGFFVRDAERRPWLVTNRHVVTGRHWETDSVDGYGGVAPSAIRVSVPMASRFGSWTQALIELGDEENQPRWREHPELGRAVDVVALEMPETDQVDIIEWPLRVGVARLGLTDTIYVIGFPVGFDPVKAIGVFGVWTRASIAWQPRLDWRELPCFLVDCRSRSGQSGSPAVFYANQITPFVGVDGQTRTGPAWSLVGVYSGRIHKESDLGIVWKRSALEQIIASGTVPAAPSVSPLEVDPKSLIPVLPSDSSGACSIKQ
jgi:hypothetical protein